LLEEQLERIDPGRGIETMRLVAPLTEPLTFAQPRADLIGDESAGAEVPVPVDRLVNRLGARKVYCAAPVESDVPERSVHRVGPLNPSTRSGWRNCPAAACPPAEAAAAGGGSGDAA
jgi:protein ImuB